MIAHRRLMTKPVGRPRGGGIAPAMAIFLAVAMISTAARAGDSQTRIYENRLTRLKNPAPLLNDHPEFVQPVIETVRYEAPLLVDDENADLQVRAWRFSYNARGIIEMPNRLRAKETAVIMVHPWGIDDGQGWRTPQPAGVADFCTIEKNHLAGRHTRTVINPFINSLRDKVGVVLFSLRGGADSVRTNLYRSIHRKPTGAQREKAQRELTKALSEFKYEGQPLPATLTLSKNNPVRDYFQQFKGLDATPRYNNEGFWDLPIPVCSDVDVFPDDVVLYDQQGYPTLKKFLRDNGIRHVLLTGYATDMCFCKTTAGFENLSKDFNVFLVGDATLATFPANNSPRYATNAHISFASLNQLITQVSWVRLVEPAK